MKKYIAFLVAFFTMLLSTAAFAACPCQLPREQAKSCCCTGCAAFETTAGVINTKKAPHRTNFGVIKKEKDLSIFEGLIKKAGLKDKVDSCEYTVFVPTNEAMNAMDQCLLENLKKPENKDKLVQFVLYHMSPGRQTVGCICERDKVVTESGCCLEVDRECNRLKVMESKIVVSDIQTKNGEIQIIDKVLLPYS